MPEEIKVIEQEGERIYTEIPPDLKHLFPSSTTITGRVDKGKSNGLMYWAAGLSFDYLIDIVLKPVRNAIEKNERDMAIELLEEFFGVDIDIHYKKAKSYHTKKSKEARDIGTYVHEAAEAIFRAMLENSPLEIPIDEDIEKPVKALLTWIKDNDVNPVLVEQQVWAYLPGIESEEDERSPEEKLGYAGRLDLVAHVNGKLTTIDHKAAKGIYEDGPLQVASYDYAYDDMVENGILNAPGPTEASAILRLDKETGFPEYREYSKELTIEYFREFKWHCCAWHEERIRKKNQKARKKEQREREKEEKKKPKKTEDPY